MFPIAMFALEAALDAPHWATLAEEVENDNFASWQSIQHLWAWVFVPSLHHPFGLRGCLLHYRQYVLSHFANVEAFW